jgi:hypothetical protein
MNNHVESFEEFFRLINQLKKAIFVLRGEYGKALKFCSLDFYFHAFGNTSIFM